jgi:hypothetical protein
VVIVLRGLSGDGLFQRKAIIVDGSLRWRRNPGAFRLSQAMTYRVYKGTMHHSGQLEVASNSFDATRDVRIRGLAASDTVWRNLQATGLRKAPEDPALARSLLSFHDRLTLRALNARHQRRREAPSADAIVTPLLIQAMTRCVRGRSCLSRLPSRPTRARVLPRQAEIAARLAA